MTTLNRPGVEFSLDTRFKGVETSCRFSVDRQTIVAVIIVQFRQVTGVQGSVDGNDDSSNRRI